MNPLAIFTLIIAAIVGFFAISSGEPGFFGGGGPIATGPSSPEVRNPQPLAQGPVFQDFTPTPPMPAPLLLPPPAPLAPPLPPGASPWRGKAAITSAQRFGDRPDQEYVIIRHQGFGGFFSGPSGTRPELIDITGWRIESLHSSAIIPRAFNIPEIDAAEQDVILPPGGELIVTSGIPSYQQNFRENACVGYLTQSHTFVPGLAASCPDAQRNRSALLRQGFNGACIDAIMAVPTCRTPQGPFEVSLIKSECLDYMNKNFSYVGCVENFRDDKGFLKNTWRVHLGRPQKLFDSRHDKITLRDQQGLLIDEFEY